MAVIKQKLAYKKVVNGMTVPNAMREAGYAASTAKNTHKLTNSKGWQELIEKNISDKALLKVHKEGLEATQVRFTPEGEKIRVEDYATRHKYLETGYKITGRLKDPGILGGSPIALLVQFIDAGNNANTEGVPKTL